MFHRIKLLDLMIYAITLLNLMFRRIMFLIFHTIAPLNFMFHRIVLLNLCFIDLHS